MAIRYYLAEGEQPECEVTKAEFVAAERRCGFINSMNQPDEPATAGFGHPNAKGRVVFTTAEAMFGGIEGRA